MASGRRTDSETPALGDELSPLLCNESPLEAQTPAKPTPFPKLPLAALCLARMVEPVTFTQIFPYVNELMNDLHLTDDPSQIGFYSGIVESTFAIAQLCSIYQWARLSDVVGRRPVILTGIAGLAIATVFFGLSQSLTSVLLSRCFAGIFSGNIAAIHSVLGELTDSTNQAVVFPIYGIFWPIGAIIGPLIGGTFSNPATRYPRLFDYKIFRTYPYFLPCLVSASVASLGVVFAYYFLDETLPSKRLHKTEKAGSNTYGATNNSSSTATGEAVSVVPDPPPSITFLLSIPAIRALCLSGCALSFVTTAFDVVFVLFAYSPIKAGGLGFSPSQIGFSMATGGCLSALIQLLVMPTLLRTFDIAKMYKFGVGVWKYAFLTMPLLNLIALRGYDEETGSLDAITIVMLWAGIGLVFLFSRLGCLSYSVSMILVKGHAPNSSSLGATNGLVQFAMCLARAIAPAFVSSAFALSIDNNLLRGYLWVVIMVSICFLGSSVAKNIQSVK